MKLQTLAVIFVLIILPISIVLSEYVQVQIDTLSLQTQYDSQLLSATYDAVAAFQKNTVNSWSSTITSSKIRDIEASANVFLTSVANNFKMSGNSKEAIKEYIPAIVYTLYDGYYIYAPFKNTLGDIEIASGSTYQDGERTFGLKPYIYYSREYTRGSDNFVITYSLDNYIQIQGIINNQSVNEGGYLIDINNASEDGTQYKGASINNEDYQEYIDKDKLCRCTKINGTKYYLYEGEIFSFVNGEKNTLSGKSAEEIKKYFDNNIAQQYYKNAYAFTQKVIGTDTSNGQFNLGNLTSVYAKEWDLYTDAGKRTDDEQGIKYTQAIYNIFNVNNIENYNSGFNQERRAVIKYSIEKNLASAIANFSNITNAPNSVNFQMPKLADDEWDKVINNVSVITFLQGINMGNRPYNGYAIVPNNKNEESVGEESIYIAVNDEYHRINDTDLLNMDLSGAIGVFNMNFERKTVDEHGQDGSTKKYFYPRKEMACYKSIVSQSATNSLINEANGIPISIYEYLNSDTVTSSSSGTQLKSIYYTALGRERYGLVKYGLKDEIEEYINHLIDGGEGGGSSSSTPEPAPVDFENPEEQEQSYIDGMIELVSGNSVKNYSEILGNPTGGENYVQFDGTDDWINFGNIDNPRTMEITFSLDTNVFSRRQHLIGNWEVAGGGIWITKDEGEIGGEFYIDNLSSYKTLYGNKIESGKKYNVSLTFDGHIIKLYVNGNKINEIPASGTIKASEAVLGIGSNPSVTKPSGVDNDSWFKGRVYAARVYTKALSDEEIMNNYEIDKNLYDIE